jgi:diguanylate cyclase (GGDEF)-like protein
MVKQGSPDPGAFSGRPLESGRQSPVLRAKALAVFFAAGATLALLAVVVPHGKHLNVAGSVSVGVLGYPVAIVLVRYGARFPTWVLHALLATGSAMVSLGIYFGHGSGPAVAVGFFYVWVAMYAFGFFPWHQAAAQLSLAGAAYAVVLVISGDSGSPAEWVLVMGTAVTVGLVMGLVSQEFERLATTDSLTGLPNRQGLADHLTRESARAHRSRRPLSLALIDLDDFKELNDRAGHRAGDDLLRELARTWSGELRAVDVVARFGGDEFVVLLPDTPVTEGQAVLRRLAVVDRVRWSAGLSQWDPDEPAEQVLARADAALYEAKRRGRHQIVLAPDSAGASSI